ncbi:hypothetical protein BSK20_04420 [SR1 bacterium human oral taxon HOT-345]|nr:hypothetical protein BSK20_04420 [SR1 bacterium human oral taxon HOT-345]
MEAALIFFGFINVVSFTIRGIDKWKAKNKKWRISEKTLLILSICGGWLGAILAIDVFRHKTVKSSFLWKFYLIGGFWIAILFGVLYFW